MSMKGSFLVEDVKRWPRFSNENRIEPFGRKSFTELPFISTLLAVRIA